MQQRTNVADAAAAAVSTATGAASSDTHHSACKAAQIHLNPIYFQLAIELDPLLSGSVIQSKRAVQ